MHCGFGKAGQGQGYSSARSTHDESPSAARGVFVVAATHSGTAAALARARLVRGELAAFLEHVQRVRDARAHALHVERELIGDLGGVPLYAVGHQSPDALEQLDSLFRSSGIPSGVVLQARGTDGYTWGAGLTLGVYEA